MYPTLHVRQRRAGHPIEEMIHMFDTTASGKRFSLTMVLALALVVPRTKGTRS